MSRKNIQVKRESSLVGGEQPNHNFKGIVAQAKALRGKYRSPIGFCGPRRKQP